MLLHSRHSVALKCLQKASAHHGINYHYNCSDTNLHEFDFISLSYLPFTQLARGNTELIIYGINGLLDKCSLCFKEFPGLLILCFQNTHMGSVSKQLLTPCLNFHVSCSGSSQMHDAWGAFHYFSDVMTDLATSVNM